MSPKTRLMSRKEKEDLMPADLLKLLNLRSVGTRKERGFQDLAKA